jgi:hypothetical protein
MESLGVVGVGIHEGGEGKRPPGYFRWPAFLPGDQDCAVFLPQLPQNLSPTLSS